MRRTLQAIALLIAILCGSVPGIWLLASARSEPCRCGTVPMDSCPCRMPSRAPHAPCAPGASAPVAALAAPCTAVLAAARPARTEPSPLPPSLLAAFGQYPDRGPAVMGRPGPAPPPDPGPDRLALMSLLRI